MKKSRICWIRILFPVFAVLLFSIFLLTLKVNVNAAGNDSSVYFPMEQNENSHFDSSMRRLIDENLDTTNYYYFVSYINQDLSYANDNFYYVRYPKSEGSGKLFAEIFNNGYQFSLYKSDNPSLQIGAAYIHWVGGVTPEFHFDNRTITLEVFQNLNSSSYSSSRGYLSNFRLYTSSNVSTRKVVLNYGVDNHHDPKPPRPDDPVYDSSDSAPSQVPFNNSVSSDTGFLAKTFQYFGNLINSNLNEFKENLFDNLLPFISIFSDLYNLGLDENGGFSVGGVFTSLLVPSSQQLIQAVIEHDDFDFIGTSKVVLTDAPRILSQLYNVTSTPIFHVPSCTFHGVEIGDFDISFAWFAPYKVYYDVIVSTFLVIAYIYWIFISMHGHIRTTYTPGPQEEEYWRY